MSQLEEELERNCTTFQDDWQQQIQSNWTTLLHEKVFLDSYKRLSALNGMKTTLIVPNVSAGSAAFFLEAHNDALISHVAASCGSWRTALQSLRSCIENSLNCLYFKDHPIELQLWEKGSFRPGFTDLLKYAMSHPLIGSKLIQISGLTTLKKEYATLSRAVHASSVNFRMTEPSASVLLWSGDTVRARKWAAREREVVEGVALLWAVIFRDRLSGAQNVPLRDALYFAIRPSKRTSLRDTLHISIAKP